jgi:hypothetical protein
VAKQHEYQSLHIPSCNFLKYSEMKITTQKEKKIGCKIFLKNEMKLNGM